MSWLKQSTTEPTWEGAFVLELRLRGASGQTVGDAVASVESFCHDSGQTPQEAFGDPVDYAASLISDDSVQVTDPREMRGVFVSSVAQFLGLLLTVDAFTAWQADRHLEVRGGTLVLAATVVVGTAVMCLKSDAFLRSLFHARPGKFFGSFVAWACVGLGVGFFLREPILEIPVVPAAVVGLVALLVPPVVAQLWGLHRDDDPVVSPTGEVEETGRGVRVAFVVLNWMMPIAAAFFVTMWWLLG